jgi:CheY-like chemotaxis protein
LHKSYPGTGIGLALVRKAVERMGGRVGLESEPGHGSRFWIELQRADGVSNPNHSKEIVRSGLPHPLQVVVNGVEAIDYLGGTGPFADRGLYPLPCLVLLDLKMPLKDGFEVLVWIRQQPPFAALPVIVYTSSGGGADREKACQLGATYYVVKKADIGEIAEWLQSLIHHCEPEPARG